MIVITEYNRTNYALIPLLDVKVILQVLTTKIKDGNERNKTDNRQII